MDIAAARRAAAARTAQAVHRATASAGAEAYVTLVVNTRGTDYFAGLLALAASLADSRTSRPLLVLLVGPKTPALAHAESCLNFTIVPLQPIENVRWGKPTRLRVTRHNDTFSKLYLFGVNAERIVYIDADTIVLRNIDELFDQSQQGRFGADDRRSATCCPGGLDAPVSAVPDFGYACGTSRAAGVCRRAFARGNHFNTGVMRVRPSLTLLEELLVRRWTTSSYDGGDQGLLNAVAREWGHGPGFLPFRYNTFAHEELIAQDSSGMFPGGKRTFDMKDVSILHYAGLKPWNRRGKHFGPQVLRAFDGAMASYRRRCSPPGRTRRGSLAQLQRDMQLAGKRVGGRVARIHLHDLTSEV